MAPTAHFKVL